MNGAHIIAALALVIWLGLIASRFWTVREQDENAPFAIPARWPDVVAVVPARDEADVILQSLQSVADQDYAGTFRIILVDDNSSDGTGDLARGLGADRIAVMDGAPLPAGWTGKLWALSQGILAAGDASYFWLTDADITHAPDTLTRLMGIAASENQGPNDRGGGKKLVSFMAVLNSEGWAARILVPAFVYFFKMIYPFGWINQPSIFAGAAGGCVLVEAGALRDAGGVAAMRGALIDDCTLGALIKKQGPIWLGLTKRSRSVRPYRHAGEVGAMIARSAYAQLRYNPLLLLATVLGLGLVFVAPVWLLVCGDGWVRIMAGLAAGLMVLSWQPVLAFYRRSALWGVALPLVAGFYALCTLVSAWMYYRGQGGMWKGRAQAQVEKAR